jgi:hypothetical protein
MVLRSFGGCSCVMRSVRTSDKTPQFAALALGALLAAIPAMGYAAQATINKTIDYSTSMRPINTIDYPVTGELQIRTSKNGIITGYYRPADNNDFIPVTGGVNGDHVWIDIGRAGGTRINGQFKDGNIVGSAMTNHGIMQFTASAPQIEQNSSSDRSAAY